MPDEILFQVTQDKLETGLRGVPVGYCTTSYVDPQKGLFYIDKPIAQLAAWTPTQVMYLLYFGKEGSSSQVAAFARELDARSTLSAETSAALAALPKKGSPMKLFSAALLLLGLFEATGDYKEDGFNLIAKLPHLVASLINHHAGWGETPAPQKGLGYMESFVRMLRVPGARAEELTRALNLFHILHLDHGGGNLSTFVGKAVASGLEDLYGSIASALCALAGARHGKANQDCLEFLLTVMREVGENATEADVERLLRERLAHNQLIFGFGHAVLRVEDPRATVQYGFLQEHYAHNPLCRMAQVLRTVGPKVLKENPKITDPYPNVDAVSGVVLTAAGFGYPEYYTVLFGLARSVGISIQILYERCEARDKKGTPIIRPKYIFKKRS